MGLSIVIQKYRNRWLSVQDKVFLAIKGSLAVWREVVQQSVHVKATCAPNSPCKTIDRL